MTAANYHVNNETLFFVFKSDVNATVDEMIPSLFCLICASVAICVICEIGQQLTDQFNAFDDALCNCKWYSMPIELRKMLVIVMSNTQQATYMHGYGNIMATRDSFKEVRNTF